MMKIAATLLVLLAALTTNAITPYEIYPIPHSQSMLTGHATFTPSVDVVAEAGIDEVTIERARQVLTDHGMTTRLAQRTPGNGSCVILATARPGSQAARMLERLNISSGVLNTPGKYDRYILALTAGSDGAAQVVIIGEHTDAAFCALASLEQMLDQRGVDGRMPCTVLHDYADVQNRGIIEGYYGVPYSAEVTKDLFRFMARYKMNTYMYGAKSDTYHSRYWADPYPTTITDEQRRLGMLTSQQMSDITQAATAAKVNFVWAIHPGNAFANPNDGDVLDRIMQKFEAMHQLGVRQFGVFVDDVGVPSDPAVMRLCADNLTALQQRIDNRWNIPGANQADTVRPLHYVPQLYAYGWVDMQQAQRFYESLKSVPKKVNIYITGRNVWSVPNNHDLSLVSQWLGREVSWWWNYPCNDQDPTKLFVMDTYTNFRDETHILSLDRLEHELRGTRTVIINPMQQGELSKVALFSVADYTWNNDAFNCHRSWQAAIPAVAGPDYADALQRAAPLLRYYDADALDYYIIRYKQSVEQGRPTPGALINLLNDVRHACQQLSTMQHSTIKSERLLHDDLRPWLRCLHDMTVEAVALLQGDNPPANDYQHNPDYQFSILGGMGDQIELQTRTAQPAAQSLAPFIQWLRQQLQHPEKHQNR